jgi:beta-mannosidase
VSETAGGELALELSGPWQFQVAAVSTPDALALDAWRECDRHDAELAQSHVVWYRTVSEWRSTACERLFLRFEGADYRAQVWLDGVYLGEHTGYCGSFSFDVSAWRDHVGPLTLLVRVAWPEEVLGAWPARKRWLRGAFGQHPGHLGAWHIEDGQASSSGGLWGRVWLIGRLSRHLASLRHAVRVVADETWLEIESAWAGIGAESLWVWSLVDPDGAAVGQAERRVGATDERTVIAIRVAQPRWWWSWDQGDAAFYWLEATNGLERHRVRVALRTVVRDTQGVWWLNQRRVFLRGAYVLPGWCLAKQDAAWAAEQVRSIRASGLNVLRVHAHMAHPVFYEACDAAGVMVIQDAPLYGAYDVTAELCEALTQQVSELVERYWHHPAIIAWGVNTGGHRDVDVPADWAMHVFARSDATRPVLRSRMPSLAACAEVLEFEEAGLAMGAHVALPVGDTLNEWVANGLLRPDDACTWGRLGWMRPMPAVVDWPDAVVRGQRAQAEFVLDWVDGARRRRFEGVAGYFYYWLADAAPVIGSALRDATGRLKAAGEVFAAVSAPLYPSLRLLQAEVLAGLAIAPDLRVVNDSGEAYTDLRVQLTLLDEAGNERSAVTSVAFDVAAGAVHVLDAEWIDTLPTHPGWHGDFTLEALILRFGRPLAALERALRLLPRHEGQAAYLQSGYG